MKIELPTLETSRLILRKIILDDAESIYSYASNRMVTRYTDWDYHKSLEETIEYLKDLHIKYEKEDYFDWGIVLKKDNRLIGSCGIPVWDKKNLNAEIGYVISQDCWSMGYVTEAVSRIIEFAFETLKVVRISAKCCSENIGSERVMQKCGMKFEGILRKRIFSDDRFHDAKVYSILDSDRI